MSRLLINENPMMILPNLAEKIGLNEAVVLQQLHYLMNPEFNKNLINGRYWVYNTYEEWQRKFKFWSERTVQRIFLNLEEKRLVLAEKLSKDSNDRTKWYTIDYDSLNSLDIGASCQNGTMATHDDKVARSDDANLARSHSANLAPCNKEQRLHTKITSKDIKTRVCTRALNGVSENPNVEPSIDASVDNNNQLNKLKKIDDEKTQLPVPSRSVEKFSKGKFDTFWQTYPNKVGKGAVRTAFEKALKKTSLIAIVEALGLQKLEKEECDRLGVWAAPWPNPATWLNQERWSDVVKTHEELNLEAKANWKSKMSYRDAMKIQSSQKHAAIEKRIRERALNASIKVQSD